jgi:RND family efflux transporter MFP subunit
MLQAADEPRRVTVEKVQAREVTDYADFTGRTVAAATVEVRARVSGYLVKVDFKEGAEVKKGDVLFEIDPRPYQADLDKAAAGVAQAEAHYQRTEADFKRAKELMTRGVISQPDFDKIVGDRAEAEAAVRVERAKYAAARLYMEYTRVFAPINGIIGRRLVDVGSLVKADETMLATIVSRDPMYVAFDLDERTLLQLRRRMREETNMPVEMALADEGGFPRRGKVDAIDNHVDPATGTLRMRAVFANADGLLVPGLFVRVRLRLGAPYKALMVPEKAVGKSGNQAFVFVVTDKNLIEFRSVTLGLMHNDYRVIKEGLREGDRVVSSGLHELRAGMTVVPTVASPREKP